MAYADRMAGSRRVATMAGVALVHGALGYVLASGMAVEMMRGVTRTLTTTNVPLPPVPPPDPVTQPPKPAQAVAKKETAITFVDRTMEVPAANNRVAIEDGPVTPPLPYPQPSAEPPADPPPPASLARGPAIRGARAQWITNADYPASAIRAEEEGRVGITVQIGADGRVATCGVTEPSGSPTLDAATCRLYRARARFDAARDDAGKPIASRYSDRVRWQLPE